MVTYSSLSSPLVVGLVSRSDASSSRHQASLRNCQTLLYVRELSLTADPFDGSSVAERVPPAGEQQANAMRPSHYAGSLGSCLVRPGQPRRDRRGVCAAVGVVAFVELA